MSKPESLSPVTPEHARYFGHIINIFARIEHQMMVCVAGMLDSDLATAHILMADTHYRQKQQIVRHLNTTLGINGHVNQDLIAVLDDLHKLSSLRNAIAHCIWTKGNRPGTIKPMQLNLRAKEPKPLGHQHNERGYTSDELKAEANKLEAISRRFRDLLDRSRLWATVEAKINKIPSSITPSPGKPSSK
jgi:hypothetical protein